MKNILKMIFMVIFMVMLLCGVVSGTETYNRYDIPSNKLLLSTFSTGEWTKTSGTGTVNDSTTNEN
jgi:hypothetical protein